MGYPSSTHILGNDLWLSTSPWYSNELKPTSVLRIVEDFKNGTLTTHIFILRQFHRMMLLDLSSLKHLFGQHQNWWLITHVTRICTWWLLVDILWQTTVSGWHSHDSLRLMVETSIYCEKKPIWQLDLRWTTHKPQFLRLFSCCLRCLIPRKSWFRTGCCLSSPANTSDLR